VPAGTPEPILARLGAELQAMLAKPQVRVALSNAGVDAAPGTRDAAAETMTDGMRRVTALMDRIGFQPR